MEVEAKFDLTRPATARELSTATELGPFRLGISENLRVTDQYVDTNRRDCLRQGYTCRLRISEHGTIVTLKGLDPIEGESPTGTFRREEIEQELAAATLDPSLWPRGPARDLVERLSQGRGLLPVLALRQERLERSLLDGERVVAALTVDHVRPELAGREQLVYSVVEVELNEQGTEADLMRAIAALQALPGLSPATQSKFERGLALLRQADDVSSRTRVVR